MSYADHFCKTNKQLVSMIYRPLKKIAGLINSDITLLTTNVEENHSRQQNANLEIVNLFF